MIAAIARAFDRREQRLLETVSQLLAMDRRYNHLKFEAVSRAIADIASGPRERAPHVNEEPAQHPCVSALEDGRIGLFVGTGYRFVSRAEALAYARAIVDAVLESSRREHGAQAESRA